LGYNNLNYDTDRFEGWYWKRIRNYPTNTKGLIPWLPNAQLIENTVFYPVENANEDFEISVRFATLIRDSEYAALGNINRKIYTVINADTVNRAYFDTLEDNYIATAKISPQKLFAGVNSLQIVNLTNDTSDSWIGVDWFKIRGFTKPFAFNSNSVFDVKNVSENSVIKISGFSDSMIIIYDTVSKSLKEKIAIPTVTISANARTFSANENSTPFVSLRINDAIEPDKINDTNCLFEKEGFHIGILRKGTTVAEFHSFIDFNNSLFQLLQNINNGSFVAIAYNGKNDFPQNVKNFLIENGCSQINNFVVGTAYTCAFKVGDSKAFERYSKNYISKLDTTFFDEEKRNFLIEFNVAGDFENPISYSFNICDAKAIQNVDIEKAKKTDYKNTENAAEMIIIYHKEFEKNAHEYANYRINQGHKIFLADVEEVYKEFGFGKKTPHTIKNFLNYAYKNWQKPAPRYVLLIGNASNDPRMCDTKSKTLDFIPTYGNPASDYWYGLFDMNNTEHKAEMIVGRIPASTNEHIENYFEKVKSYEATKDAKWHKRFLFVNGGISVKEKNIIRQDAQYLGSFFYRNPFCADTVMINKDLDDFGATSTAKRSEIISAVNNGAMFTVFQGHGSRSNFDLWGWEVDNLNNKNRFGILVTMSCNTGDFAYSQETTVNEDFILKSKDKGFIAALGATTVSTLGSNSDLMYGLITEMLPDHHHQIKPNQRRIGDLLENAKRKLNYWTISEFPKVLRFCFGILGDPMLEIKIDTLPDIFVNANEIVVRNENNSAFIQENDDTVWVSFPVHNLGIGVNGGFTVKLIHTYEDEQKEYFHPLSQFCRSENLFFKIPVKGKGGEHTLTVIADYENNIVENNKGNNIATVKFYVYRFGLLAVDPQPYWNRYREINNPIFRVTNPLSKLSNFEYYFSIERIVDDGIVLIKNSTPEEIIETENYIDWKPDIELEGSRENFLFSAQQKDLNTGLVSDKLTVPFNTHYGSSMTAIVSQAASFSLFTKEGLNNFKLENMIIKDTVYDNYPTSVIVLADGFQSGRAISPIIGPASLWLEAYMMGNFYGNKIIVYGLKDINSTPEKLFEIDTLKINFIVDYSFIPLYSDIVDAKEYPYIQVEYSASLTNDSRPCVSAIYLDFFPSAELAMRSETNFLAKNVLRGDTAILNLEIENISLRSESFPTKISVDIFSDFSGTLDSLVFDLPSIPRNSAVNLQYDIESDFFENDNTVIITADSEKINNELYFFNNSITVPLKVYEDTIPPQLEIAFDGEIIKDRDYISSKPFIEVKLLDNSNLPVTVAEPITVRLNGVRLNASNTEDYDLNANFPKGSPIKAILKLTPNEITEPVNYFSFSGVDASGNPVVENYYLYISLNNFIRDLRVYPNPTTRTDNFTFSYYLVSPFTELEAELEIYNVLGSHINTLRFPTKMRTNVIPWDMRDHSGNTINPGTYYYRLNIISDFWTDPVYGWFVFSK